MTDTRELDSVVAAAEQAASAGNHMAAEQLLREAALLQEASLGSRHPDLANTLNNLGVVCEITGKAADAEQFYRRAYAIATAVLAPDHPFVATSEKNLREFCAARGRPLELPQPIAVPEAAQEPRTAPAAAREPKAQVSTLPPQERAADPDSQPSGQKTAVRPSAIGFLGAYVIVFAILMAGYLWFRADTPDSSPPASATSSVKPTPTPPPEPSPVTSVPTPTPPASAAQTAAPARAPTGAPAAARTPAAAAGPPAARPPAAPVPPTVAPGLTAPSTLVAPAVAEAQLCRNLSRSGDWRCDPAGNPVDPGTLFFYTRLKVTSDTTVHHRWYRGDRLAQAVDLRIRANPGSGYRTYSRNTVNPQTAGEWRVELTAANGTLLHEVRFVVR